ncbi:tetratricopeptide repeat protein [Streptomyces eurythermus]
MLLEQREVELLVQAASERGEWFCAEAAVRELSRAGEAERALEVLEPFIEAGWRPARWKRAEVLLEAGRVRQALDEVRPDEEGLASERVCHDFAELLAKAGRLDESITVLTPHLDSRWILSALVELTEGRGRDEQVLELIAPRAQRVRSARGGKRWCVEPSNAQDLQARVLERAGRVDEAIRILGADIAAGHFVVQNTLIAYAELLLRHGRIEELRVLGTGERADDTLAYYARALEDHGLADEAEAVLRRFIATAEHPDRFRRPLIELLGRQGRIEEAVEVGRPTFEYHDACLFEGVIHLLHEAGRPDDAVALLDERSAEFVEEHPSWVSSNRMWLLGEAGRYAEALAYAETLPPDMYGLTVEKAWILEKSGRFDEALALLRSDAEVRPWEVADLLIRHGRAAEAVATMPSLAEQHAAYKRRDAAMQANRDPNTPPFQLSGLRTGTTPSDISAEAAANAVTARRSCLLRTTWLASPVMVVLEIFEADQPDDSRPRDAISAVRAFAGGGERGKSLRDTAAAALKAARSAHTAAAREAAWAAMSAAGAAYLHPLAKATQVKHILGASAYAARAAELVADDDRSVGAEHLKRMAHRATPVVVDVLKRFPSAPEGGGRVGELIRMLDADLRSLALTE